MAGFGPLEVTEELQDRRLDHWPAARCPLQSRAGAAKSSDPGAGGFDGGNRGEFIEDMPEGGRSGCLGRDPEAGCGTGTEG
jgi:hypothetical protein